MKQEISNNEEDRIEYIYKMQQIAKKLKKAYLKRKITIERLKLHRQSAILKKSRHEYAKLS